MSNFSCFLTSPLPSLTSGLLKNRFSNVADGGPWGVLAFVTHGLFGPPVFPFQ
jgi:hypothetical protein